MPVIQRTSYLMGLLLLFVKLLCLVYREAWQKPTYHGQNVYSLEGLCHLKTVVL